MTAVPEPARLSDVLAVLARQRVALVTAAVAGLALGLLGSALAPERYTATASVVVGDLEVPSPGSSDGPNLPTEAALVTSSRVVEMAVRTMAAHHPDVSAPSVADSTSVSPEADSHVLRIRYTAARPDEARDGATALAAAYLETRRRDATDDVVASRRRLEERVRELQHRRGAGRDVQLEELGRRLADLETADLDPGQVVDSPGDVADRSTPGAAALGAGGLVLGVILGAAVVLARAGAPPATAAPRPTR